MRFQREYLFLTTSTLSCIPLSPEIEYIPSSTSVARPALLLQLSDPEAAKNKEATAAYQLPLLTVPNFAISRWPTSL
jgi:hypothetical protein